MSASFARHARKMELMGLGRLIVAACLVEVGEVVARLIVHATTANSPIPSFGPLSLARHAIANSLVRSAPSLPVVANVSTVAVRHADAFLDLSGMSRDEALNAVEIMMRAAGK